MAPRKCGPIFSLLRAPDPVRASPTRTARDGPCATGSARPDRVIAARADGAARAYLPTLEHQSRPSHLTRGDRGRLAAILPAAGGVFGSELFLTRDLFASEAAALRLVLRGPNVKQVHRFVPPGGRADGRRLSDSRAG